MIFRVVSAGAVFGSTCWAAAIPKLRPPADFIGPTFWEQYHWSIIAAAIVLSVGTALLVWLRHRPLPVEPIPLEVVTRQTLEALRERPEDLALLGEVSHCVSVFLAAVFALPAQEWTTEELTSALRKLPSVSPELGADIDRFMRECDTRKFAPASPSLPLGVVNQALELLAHVECQRPPKPPPTHSPSPAIAPKPLNL